MKLGFIERHIGLLVPVLLLFTPYTLADEKFKIGWVYAMANAPAIIAQSRGLFAKYGVDVELRQFDSGPLVKRALEAGDLQMAYIGMAPVYHAYAEGTRLKIVSKVNYGQAAIITRHDSAIRTLADLKHKRLASIRKESGMDVLLRAFILGEIAGLDSDKDVEIVTMPAKIMQASVQHGLVDAAFTWEPYVAQAVVAENARIVFDMNKQVPRYPWYVLVASEATAQHQRKKMLSVLQAHEEAIQFLNDDPDAGAKVLIEHFHLDKVISASGAKADAIDIVHQARQRLGWECQFMEADKKFLQRMVNFSLQLGLIKQTINAEDLLDQEAIDSLRN